MKLTGKPLVVAIVLAIAIGVIQDLGKIETESVLRRNGLWPA